MDFDSLAEVSGSPAALARRAVPLDRTREHPAPRNPADVLAMLLDFSGSVALAELLQAPAPRGSSHPAAADLSLKLQDKVRAQLDALSTRALKRLGATSGMRDAFEPAKLREAIERVTSMTSITGQTRVPDDKAATRLARELSVPLRAALGASIRQAQADLATLRSNIAPELRALGPRASHLERIDAALQGSIHGKLSMLFERLVLAAELAFERACITACAALPEGFGEGELTEWASETGWIGRYRERSTRMTQAFCAHLQRSLEGLLQAAIHAETAP
jgi:hypothetical protein